MCWGEAAERSEERVKWLEVERMADEAGDVEEGERDPGSDMLRSSGGW
jgi:hypothetical protein